MLSDFEIRQIRLNLSRCQGELEGILTAISCIEDFNKEGAKKILNESIKTIDESRVKLMSNK